MHCVINITTTTDTLCGNCIKGHGVTFDLRSCKDCSDRIGGWGGVLLFVVICISVIVISVIILYFDFPVPNELKGVIFFAQVCKGFLGL